MPINVKKDKLMKITDNRVDELNKRILLKTYKCKKKNGLHISYQSCTKSKK